MLQANSSVEVDFNLHDHLQLKPIILFWVSTGCYGCHDWTDALRGSVENGTLNVSSIVSIHRYADFESEQKLNDVYGTDNNSTHPSPWVVLIPNQDTPVLDYDTGTLVNDISIYEAFNHPVTPTIQILNTNGEIAWESKEYWPSEEAVEDVLQTLSETS
tara:strand:- start:12 stop:488 length:477 start_codon:yes stop_codon:yes gene_type:complete